MHFLHIALAQQFTFLKNIIHVSGNNGLVPLKKLCHLGLTEPDGLILQVHIQGGLPVFGLIHYDFAEIGIRAFVILYLVGRHLFPRVFV